MSKGSPVIPIRIPPLLLAAIDRAIVVANKANAKEPYSRSSWILHAVTEKLVHLDRAKKAARKRTARRKAEII